MKKVILFIKKHQYAIIIIGILLISSLFDFYNFPNRWGIGDDNTRDISIAKVALARHELPLIGSFSSAGPFVFGPLFYWVLMGSYLIFPFWFLAPVFVTALAGVMTVGILIACGYLLGGKRMSILVGILATTAPQLIARSLAVGQHTLVAVSAAALFLFFILYWKKKNIIYAFLMGLALGAAISFHYQALNLMIFFSAILFVPKMSWVKRIIGLLLMGVGFLIPALPLIIWDSQQQWANVRNLLDYFLVAQYRLYVPNSWKLFLFQYLPSYWALVVSGYLPIALFLIIVTFVTTAISLIKKKISLIMVVIAVMFAILLFVNRYYKGERSEGYLIYLLPFILLFTAWSIDTIFAFTAKTKYKRFGQIAGILILVIILVGNSIQIKKYESVINIKSEVNKTIDLLIKKYPNKKFVVYDYRNRNGAISQPLGLFLSLRNLTDQRGIPIGFSCPGGDCPQHLPVIVTLSGKQIVDMRGVADRDKNSANWTKTNPENMYDSLIGWSQKHALTATFSLPDYIMSKLPFVKHSSKK